MIELGPAKESDVVLAFLKAETDRWHNNEAVQNLLSSVGVTNQKLIQADFQAVEGNGTDLILIEGAHRTTAYVSLGWSKNVPAFIGNSPLMRDREFY